VISANTKILVFMSTHHQIWRKVVKHSCQDGVKN